MVVLYRHLTAPSLYIADVLKAYSYFCTLVNSDAANDCSMRKWTWGCET